MGASRPRGYLQRADGCHSPDSVAEQPLSQSAVTLSSTLGFPSAATTDDDETSDAGALWGVEGGGGCPGWGADDPGGFCLLKTARKIKWKLYPTPPRPAPPPPPPPLQPQPPPPALVVDLYLLSLSLLLPFRPVHSPSVRCSVGGGGGGGGGDAARSAACARSQTQRHQGSETAVAAARISCAALKLCAGDGREGGGGGGGGGRPVGFQARKRPLEGTADTPGTPYSVSSSSLSSPRGLCLTEALGEGGRHAVLGVARVVRYAAGYRGVPGVPGSAWIRGGTWRVANRSTTIPA